MGSIGVLVSRSAAVTVMVGSLLIAGCSSDEDDVSASSACNAYASAIIESEVRCAHNTISGSLKDDVIERKASLCVRALSMRGTSVTATKVRACADWLRSASCSADFAGSPCEMDDPGQLADGERCFDPSQCKSAHCDYSNATDSGYSILSCGVCMPRTPVGAPCSYSSVCAEGAYCSNTGVCAPYPTLGQSCEDSFRCAEGLVCSSSVCSEPLKNGDACSYESPCERGTDCIDSICSPLGQLGDECTGRCSAGLVCSSGSCSARTYAPPGGACDEDVFCQVGSCSGYTGEGVCPTLLADGAPCDDSTYITMCREGAFCIDHVCTPIDLNICD